jgi:hypothetical protein
MEFPNERHTLWSLEAMSGVGKLKKDFELLTIPEKSRFLSALRRMAFAIESSSVTAAPSTPTP